MINIVRPSAPPSSLQRPEIRAYLDALQEYKKNECEGEAPKPPGSYRGSDLLDAFEDVFFTKCYLTEQEFLNGADLEVDHFIPKGESPELAYEWSNLYPITSLANKMRPKITPEGGYLDPCNTEDDVETAIRYIIVPDHDIVKFEAVDSGNVKAKNTARLLDRLHNGHNLETKRSTSSLRRAIEKRLSQIAMQYVKYDRPGDENEKAVAKSILEKYFSKRSQFTMLMRHSETGKRLVDFHID